MFDQAKSWPFQEARKLLAHIERKGKKPGDTVTFESGYGPSGAPHIGTFAEVVRTLWVMKAFDAITDNAYRTRLIMFSDDYDAMRKVPDGMPLWMNEHLGKPLSSVPDPYQEDPGVTQVMVDKISFAEANNSKLIAFVDNILKTYDGSVVGSGPDRSRVSFVSSTRYYKSGKFNDMLDRIWDNYAAIQAVMLPTLGEERRATYSPFMPLDVDSGTLVQSGVTITDNNTLLREDNVPVIADTMMRMVRYDLPDGNTAHSLTNGRTKLQWKVDWAMRWVYFDVDYEMSGKDLIDSVKASSKICRILGGTPPLNLTYEMFLDETGAKIAKTKGNGFSIEQWLTYGTTGSLMTFLFQSPKAAKPLHIELVPKMEDEYIKMRQKDLGPNDAAWFFKADGFNSQIPDISFNLLLNLVIVSQARTADEVVRYLSQQRELPQSEKAWVHLMAHRVIAYATQQGLFARQLRQPTDVEARAFSELADRFSMMLANMDAEAFQYQVYEVGKKYEFTPLRSWFQALYECLLGSSDGPRFGAFTQAYGLDNTIRLLRQYENLTASVVTLVVSND